MDKSSFLVNRVLLVCILFFIFAQGSRSESLYDIAPSGRVSIGKAIMESLIADPAWHFYSNHDWKNVTTEIETEKTTYRGEFTFGGTNCRAFEMVAPLEDGKSGFCITWGFDTEEEVAANRVMSHLAVPAKFAKTVEVDGKSMQIPTIPNGETIASINFRTLRVNVSSGTVVTISSDEPVEMEIFDSRVWNETNICFRFNHNPARGNIKFSRLSLSVAIKRVEAESDNDADGEFVLSENDDWHLIEFNSNPIPGSPLDFSFMNDGLPAGIFGRMFVTSEGHLAFEKAPGKKIRLFGTNICFNAATPSHGAADRIAGILRRLGYNTVRLHHIDTRWSLIDFNAEDSITFIPERLDNFFYLIHALEEQGMYITIDLYSARTLKAGDKIKGIDSTLDAGMAYKTLFCFEPTARENWKEYSRRLLCTVNPYTGKTLAEDPALFCINLVNEDTLSSVWAAFPVGKAATEKAFQDWAKKQCIVAEANASNPYFRRFLLEAQASAHREAMDFLRNDLNCGAFLTSMNFDTALEHTTVRAIYDLVDNHAYHDHPRYPDYKNPKYTVMHQDSALDSLASTPLRLGQTRIFGKPFLVTEYHFCYPNAFRCESGLIAGAYAALQDWDGIYRFDWGTRDEHLTGVFYVGGFDMAADTVSQLADRVTAALFLRGDATPATESYMTVIPDDFTITSKIPRQSTAFTKLGLVAKIGSGSPENDFPVTQRLLSDHELRPEDINDKRIQSLYQRAYQKNAAVSSTNEIMIDSEKREMCVITPKTESLILSGGSKAAKYLKVDNANTFQNVSVISLDDKPIEDSEKLLVLCLTDSDSDGTLYARSDRSIHLKFGRPNAILWRRAIADIEINTGKHYAITALGADGQSLGAVKESLAESGTCRFHADSSAFPAGVVGYLLTVKNGEEK